LKPGVLVPRKLDSHGDHPVHLDWSSQFQSGRADMVNDETATAACLRDGIREKSGDDTGDVKIHRRNPVAATL
jgi:hypothetical protein